VTLESVLITVAEKSEQVFCGAKPHLLAGVYFFNPAFEALPCHIRFRTESYYKGSLHYRFRVRYLEDRLVMLA